MAFNYQIEFKSMGVGSGNSHFFSAPFGYRLREAKPIEMSRSTRVPLPTSMNQSMGDGDELPSYNLMIVWEQYIEDGTPA